MRSRTSTCAAWTGVRYRAGETGAGGGEREKERGVRKRKKRGGGTHSSFALRCATTEATKPMARAEQSKNMWKASDIRPRLFVQKPL